MEYTFQRSLGRITQQVSKGLGLVLEKKFRKAGYTTTSAQWTIISFLNQKNKSTQKEIGDFMGVNKVMVKRLIDSLEKNDLVKRIRSVDDKRFNKVQLTRKGQKLYRELIPFAEETLEEAYSDINSEEIEQCLDTLGKISERLEKL